MKCKFCDYECPDSQAPDCEYSSDPETGESQLCGHKECPACTFCQGRTDVTEQTRQTAQHIRLVKGAL